MKSPCIVFGELISDINSLIELPESQNRLCGLKIGERMFNVRTKFFTPDAVGNPQSEARRTIANYLDWAKKRGTADAAGQAKRIVEFSTV